MHFFKTEPDTLAKEFKAMALAVMKDEAITQDELADAIGVDRTTISRWFSYGGDLHLPAAITSMLRSGKLPKLALAIIRFQALPFGVTVRENAHPSQVNGSLDDELLEIGRLEGKMIEAKDKNMRQVLRLCDEMDRITHRMRLEASEKNHG